MRGACRPALIGLLVAAALSLWNAAPAHAESASLVADLETSATGSDSSPHSFFVDRGKVFFLARERSAGQEVWVSDGTANGTEMLVDACPGDCNSDVTFLGAAHGYVFWVDSKNERLWSSDGTAAHTGPLPGTGTTLEVLDTEDIAFAGGFLYFPACSDRPQICGLWRSDGTAAGTQEVPGTQSVYTSSPRDLAALGNKVYFAARSDGDDGELWVTDGTSHGTQVVRSFSAQMPRLLTAAGGKLFFIAGQDLEDQSDEELWVSDGTAAGTRRVSRFDAHQPFAPTHWLKAAGSQVYFLADDVTHGVEIWRSDGTEAGTVRVTEFGTEDPFNGRLDPSDLALAGNRLVFRAEDGLTPYDLWATSGTPESTVGIADLCAPSCVPDYNLLSAGSRVLFVADDDAHGREVWGTDGTPAGTAMLGDLCPGPCDAIQDIPRADRRQLFGDGFFVAAETPPDIYHPERVRVNLWKSDGTVAGTRRWTDFAVDSAVLTSYFPAAVPLGGSLLFAASLVGEDGLELWASNGRPGGTRQVADLDRARRGAAPGPFAAWGDRLVFSGCAGGECHVWLTSGTAESTRPVEGDTGHSGGGLAVAGGVLFFWQGGSANDLELWRTDGTAAGTRSLLAVGYPDRVYPRQLPVLGNRVFFQVSRGYYPGDRQEIWQSDGTVQGTRMVFLLPDGWDPPVSLAAVGGAVYFAVNDRFGRNGQLWRTDGTPAGTGVVFSRDEDLKLPGVSSGSRLYFESIGDQITLWRTDGTAAGTVPLTTASEVGFDDIADAIEWRGALYFLRPEGNGGSLWRTDGTAAGTVNVRTFRADDSPRAAGFVLLGDVLYFAIDDGVHGRELWKSDGTTAGTVLVRDIFPGKSGSGLNDLTVAGGALYFSADDGVHGFELWQSDGTAAGTRLVQDIAPGPISSAPAELRQVGGRLYFSADDGLTGSELWTLPLAAGPGCVASSTRLCLSGGRFAVEAAWNAQGRSGTGTAVPLTADTGYFWFFGPDNAEVILKVLDGRGVNGHHWVFYGALSDVSYTLTVTDTQTGAAVRYANVAGQLASVADTQAFGPLGAYGTQILERAAAAASLRPLALAAERIDPKAATGTCQESASRLCLNSGRFAVEASWKAQGRNGTGRGVELTGDTGYFWFFDPGNVEVVLKVLDGTGVNGKLWVFYGALSDVEYTLTVTDTQTGKVRTYTNPAGRLASIADTAAF